MCYGVLQCLRDTRCLRCSRRPYFTRGSAEECSLPQFCRLCPSELSHWHVRNHQACPSAASGCITASYQQKSTQSGPPAPGWDLEEWGPVSALQPHPDGANRPACEVLRPRVPERGSGWCALGFSTCFACAREEMPQAQGGPGACSLWRSPAVPHPHLPGACTRSARTWSPRWESAVVLRGGCPSAVWIEEDKEQKLVCCASLILSFFCSRTSLVTPGVQYCCSAVSVRGSSDVCVLWGGGRRARSWEGSHGAPGCNRRCPRGRTLRITQVPAQSSGVFFPPWPPSL